ncbi:hypothetical protein MC885_007605 [Smutsia gigantea]|nr:hypothetical protein MC885_007605 [Smutsia gigantea]
MSYKMQPLESAGSILAGSRGHGHSGQRPSTQPLGKSSSPPPAPGASHLGQLGSAAPPQRGRLQESRRRASAAAGQPAAWPGNHASSAPARTPRASRAFARLPAPGLPAPCQGRGGRSPRSSMNLRLCLQALLLLWLSLTAVCGEGRGMDQGPCREVGGNSAASGHASPIRAPCLSEAGLKGPPSAQPLQSLLLHRLVCCSGALAFVRLSSCTCPSC